MRNRMKTTPKENGSDRLLEMIETSYALKQADNRKILWLAMQTPAWKLVAETYDLQNDIFNEIENRLYPEYDGDKVKATDFGWETPEGEVRYV